MSKINISYHNLLSKIMKEGYVYDDPNRKNVKRVEILSYTFKHDFKDGFPAISTKKLQYKNVVTELIWFLRGDANIKYLVDNSCNIWNKDAYNYYVKQMNNRGGAILKIEEYIRQIKDSGKMIYHGFEFGDLGPVYGRQWRNFNGMDQIQRLITNLKEKPLATDHIVNSWNVGDLNNMALPPCHYGFQVVVKPYYEAGLRHEYDKNNLKGAKYGFELHWSQRSVDTFLGLPYNIASYATLALILEKITGYKALGIQGDLKKVHLYDNSLDAVKEQLSRNVDKYDKCELKFDNASYKYGTIYKDMDMFLDELYPEDFELVNYNSYPSINVEMLERNE